MKLIRTASGKRKIKLSKKEWNIIGKKAGWNSKSATDWGQVQRHNEGTNVNNRIYGVVKEYVEGLPAEVEQLEKHQELSVEDHSKIRAAASEIERVWGQIKDRFEMVQQHKMGGYVDTGWAYDDDDPRNKTPREYLHEDDINAEFGNMPDFIADQESWEQRAKESLDDHMAMVAEKDIQPAIRYIETKSNIIEELSYGKSQRGEPPIPSIATMRGYFIEGQMAAEEDRMMYGDD